MKTLFDPFRVAVAQSLQTVLRDAPFNQSAEDTEIFTLTERIVDPPDSEMGDLAFPCFIFAKAMKKNPAQVAQELQGRIASVSGQVTPQISKVEAAGPYLNFTFSADAFGKSLLTPIISGEVFKQKLSEKTLRTMIEFSQPNTHKELHVGHMRNLCLGDALVRLMRYANYDIVSTTFPGDVGTHVAKCLWYMKTQNKEAVPADNRGEWLGQMYSRANILLEDQVGTPAEAQNREVLTKILHQLEQKSGEYYDLWKETRQWSIELMQQVYAWADVKFDKWYWESDVDAASTQYVKQLLAEGKLKLSQGAVGMDLEADKLGFCLLLKTDGAGLYATKDLELARRKFSEHRIEKSIYVVDTRQAFHFAQVFKVLEHLGFPQAKDCYHLQYNFVELPDGAMSSRKGNIVPLMDLVQRMRDRVKKDYLNKYIGEWTSEEIELTADQVAKGAIKFGMLKMDAQKKIVFDMEEWLKIEGESGPFVQYSTARIFSLCRKFNFDPKKQVHYGLLSSAPEHQLMQQLMHFNWVATKCAEDMKPSVLCTHLVEIAKKFNYFYHECSIGQAGTEDLKNARLALSFATSEVLQQGMKLLGIPCPARM